MTYVSLLFSDRRFNAKGVYADILLVDANPLQDPSVIGTNEKWFDAPQPRGSLATILIIMKYGVIYKNTI